MIGESVLHFVVSYLRDVIDSRRSDNGQQEEDSAISKLREKYADGEITEEEFRERKQVLEEN